MFLPSSYFGFKRKIDKDFGLTCSRNVQHGGDTTSGYKVIDMQDKSYLWDKHRFDYMPTTDVILSEE